MRAREVRSSGWRGVKEVAIKDDVGGVAWWRSVESITGLEFCQLEQEPNGILDHLLAAGHIYTQAVWDDDGHRWAWRLALKDPWSYDSLDRHSRWA
jgi:hypothetical protein